MTAIVAGLREASPATMNPSTLHPEQTHWNQSLRDLDTIRKHHSDPGQDETESGFIGITRRHWQPNNSRTACANKSCGKKFTFTDRQFHCWSCGDIFCKPCTEFRRKLNNLAKFDPQGKSYNVCEACFETGRKQTLGQTRNLGGVFKFIKDNNRQLQTMLVDNGRYLHRENFNIDKEIKRVIAGFKRDIGTSGIKKLFHEFRSLTSPPDWMRAARYQVAKYVNTCFSCNSEFGILRKSYDCVLCGELYCGKCSTCDFLVYIDDEEKSKPDAEPQVAIIKIVGSPEKEPDISIDLRICSACQNVMIKKQVEVYQSKRLLSAMDDTWMDINAIYESTAKRKRKIEEYLPKYQDLVGSFEDATLGPKAGKDNRSTIQMLAKAQEDLSDHFTQLIMVSNELKRLKPTTEGQKTILKNLTLDVINYYHENMFIFRESKKKLESFTPLEVLVAIQEIVEKNTVNSAYLSIKQLGFEVLHLCLKYEMDSSIPQKIADVDEVILQELKKRVLRANEDWEDHQSAMNELIQIQLKQHRIIRPSRRMTSAMGVGYVRQFILERCDTIVDKIKLQISSKCVDKSFTSSKDSLADLHGFVVECLGDIGSESVARPK
ncbi:uncharacterized protein LOC135494995 isoform X2 [Lineus longissimus]|uniref:uncharacterized protein LOC135494995 isoform X2 n=1 Tax=Lineus longissimus TaxID=88925 RepID=UPI00315C873B